MKVVFTSSAEKELLSLDTILRKRIFEKIMTLPLDPYQIGSQKLGGGEGYRIRIGNYRVVYSIDKETKIITIIKIKHRREVYR